MQTTKKVLVILADGFEEVEALGPIDVLRRCGAQVTVAGIGAKQIRGAHDVYVGCDALLSEVTDLTYDAIVLPGGMPGAKNLHESNEVSKVVLDTYGRGDFVCAICASPAFVLAPLHILEGKKVTCYPGCEPNAPYVAFGTDRAVRDGNIITGKGPGAALEFGLEIAKALYGSEMSQRIHDDMIC